MSKKEGSLVLGTGSVSKKGVLGTGEARKRGVLGTGQDKKGGLYTEAHTCNGHICESPPPPSIHQSPGLN